MCRDTPLLYFSSGWLLWDSAKCVCSFPLLLMNWWRCLIFAQATNSNWRRKANSRIGDRDRTREKLVPDARRLRSFGMAAPRIRHASSLFSLLRPSCYSFYFTKWSVRQPLHPSTKKPVGDVSNSCEQLNRRLITVREMSRKTLHVIRIYLLEFENYSGQVNCV